MTQLNVIKIVIHEPGDPDAGISDGYFEWDTGLYEFEDDSHRENVRQHADLLYQQINGEHGRVTFSDECPE